MGERCNRTAEVRGSIPLGSTNSFKYLRGYSKIPLALVAHLSHTGAGLRRSATLVEARSGGSEHVQVLAFDGWQLPPRRRIILGHSLAANAKRRCTYAVIGDD